MASEKNLNLKQETVQNIIEKINASETVVLFAYQGLTVADISDLRRKLRDDQAEVKVYKNTLVKRALNELNLNLDEFLEGPNAMLFSTKLLEAIKVLSSFAKEHENLQIRAGIIKGDIVNVDTIQEYANIPSMEGLLTMLAGGMIEHVKNLSISLNLLAEKLNDGTVETKEETVKEETPTAEETPAEEVSTETVEPNETEETPSEEN